MQRSARHARGSGGSPAEEAPPLLDGPDVCPVVTEPAEEEMPPVRTPLAAAVHVVLATAQRHRPQAVTLGRDFPERPRVPLRTHDRESQARAVRGPAHPERAAGRGRELSRIRSRRCRPRTTPRGGQRRYASRRATRRRRGLRPHRGEAVRRPRRGPPRERLPTLPGRSRGPAAAIRPARRSGGDACLNGVRMVTTSPPPTEDCASVSV